MQHHIDELDDVKELVEALSAILLAKNATADVATQALLTIIRSIILRQEPRSAVCTFAASVFSLSPNMNTRDIYEIFDIKPIFVRHLRAIDLARIDLESDDLTIFEAIDLYGVLVTLLTPSLSLREIIK